jgi:hypothetical protein
MSTFTIFTWDGSDLGDITRATYLLYPIDTDMGALVWTKRSEKRRLEQVRIHTYTDSIPLIVDELKPLFDLTKVGRHQAIIEGRHVILCRMVVEAGTMEYNLKDFTSHHSEVPEYLRMQIRKNYVFRWLLHLTSNTDSSMIIREHPGPIFLCLSYRDSSVCWDSKREQTTRIPSTAIDSWFTGREQVMALLREMVADRTIGQLREQINSVINRVDRSAIGLTTYILNRIFERI